MPEPFTRLSLDMIADWLGHWRAINVRGGELFSQLSPEAQMWARAQDGGFEMLIPALAMMSPDKREMALAILDDFIDIVNRLQEDDVTPPRDPVPERPSEGTMDERVSELEAENRMLRQALEMIQALAGRGLDRGPIGGEQQVSGFD